jgi:hypothetical protein
MSKSVKTVEPEIRVTKIKNRWHSRLIVNDKVYDEMACDNSLDIGWICREMLRWYSKMGNISHRAEFARDGFPERRKRAMPVGRIWCKYKLEDEKLKRKLR